MKIICDWETVMKQIYKAPVEKDNSKKYRLLCLNHIKIFNKIELFENMNDEQINFIKSDLLMAQVTKIFGSSDNFSIF